MEIYLKKHGLRITPQRLALIAVLNDYGSEHPSFTEVYTRIKTRYPNVSQSTVHNNIQLFVKLGIISSFTFNGETRYELNLEPHVNIVKADGTIIDVQNSEITQKVKQLLALLREEQDIDITHLTILAE